MHGLSESMLLHRLAKSIRINAQVTKRACRGARNRSTTGDAGDSITGDIRLAPVLDQVTPYGPVYGDVLSFRAS